jgi:hypothetical protein
MDKLKKPYYDTFHNWILQNLPNDSTMLEFGSGPGTTRFVEKFKVYSIEHDLKYVGVEPKSTYVHAPITFNSNNIKWYDENIVRNFIKDLKYDLILVDGPLGSIGRSGIKNILDILKTENIPLIFDDVNRPNEFKLMEEVSKILERKYEIYKGINRSFSVIK